MRVLHLRGGDHCRLEQAERRKESDHKNQKPILPSTSRGFDNESFQVFQIHLRAAFLSFIHIKINIIKRFY
jgi:hypothetical protein